jgi:hypothetical protein
MSGRTHPARRLRLAAAAAALLAVGGALVPDRAAAHAIGQVFTLPVPLGLYLAGAGAAVAASFVVSVVAVRPAAAVPSYPTRAVDPTVARFASVLLSVLGVTWWFGAMAAGFLVDSASPLAAILFWIGIWVGLPIIAVLLGNPWPSLSPFRTVFGLLERGAGALGLARLDAGLRYPARLGRWPAVAFLFAALWCELVLFNADSPRLIAALLAGYTLLTLVGMLLFGRVAWLRNAELFEVLLGWFGRVGPVGRRAQDPEVCAGCGEECDPARCVDCPECSVAAEPGELRPVLRPWFTGLSEVRNAGWSDAAFIVLALGGVTYDGLKETAFYGTVVQPAFDAALPLFGAANTVLVVQSAGLIVVWLLFLAAFSLATWLTHALHDADRRPPALSATVGAYAATLLPIAAGYLVAHYLTVVIQGAVWLPALIANPLNTVAPPLDFIPTSAIWYLSVGAIVLGHVVAVVLAHRLALRDAPRRAVVAGLPLVVLMVGYTVLSLWIIASPITVDPGMPAAIAVPR